MYKFKRNIYLEDRTIEMWFGLTSKSRDRHSNFTLYLLTEGAGQPVQLRGTNQEWHKLQK